MIDLETKRLETQAMLDNAELLFDQDQCRAALQKVADEITRDLGDKYPLLLPVMGGAVVFTGQLLPLLRFPLDFDYVHVSRYGDKLAGGAFNWKRMPDPEADSGASCGCVGRYFGRGTHDVGDSVQTLGNGGGELPCGCVCQQVDRQGKTNQGGLCRNGCSQPLRLRLRYGCGGLLAQFGRDLRAQPRLRQD